MNLELALEIIDIHIKSYHELAEKFPDSKPEYDHKIEALTELRTDIDDEVAEQEDWQNVEDENDAEEEFELVNED